MIQSFPDTLKYLDFVLNYIESARTYDNDLYKTYLKIDLSRPYLFFLNLTCCLFIAVLIMHKHIMQSAFNT